MKRRLYDAIKNYCEENECCRAYNTAKDWNEILGTTYSPATFTAAANSGLLERDKGYKATAYKYRLAPTEEELKERAEQARKEAEWEREDKIEKAKSYIEEGYDTAMANIKIYYERDIKRAKEDMERRIAREEKRLAEAKALLNII